MSKATEEMKKNSACLFGEALAGDLTGIGLVGFALLKSPRGIRARFIQDLLPSQPPPKRFGPVQRGRSARM